MHPDCNITAAAALYGAVAGQRLLMVDDMGVEPLPCWSVAKVSSSMSSEGAIRDDAWKAARFLKSYAGSAPTVKFDRAKAAGALAEIMADGPLDGLGANWRLLVEVWVNCYQGMI